MIELAPRTVPNMPHAGSHDGLAASFDHAGAVLAAIEEAAIQQRLDLPCRFCR